VVSRVIPVLAEIIFKLTAKGRTKTLKGLGTRSAAVGLKTPKHLPCLGLKTFYVNNCLANCPETTDFMLIDYLLNFRAGGGWGGGGGESHIKVTGVDCRTL